MRRFKRLPHLRIGGVAFGELQIFADRAVEEERLLRDVGELVAQGRFRKRGDVDAVDGDLSGVAS